MKIKDRFAYFIETHGEDIKKYKYIIGFTALGLAGSLTSIGLVIASNVNPDSSYDLESLANKVMFGSLLPLTMALGGAYIHLKNVEKSLEELSDKQTWGTPNTNKRKRWQG